MPRKFINRRSDSYKNKIESDDEWAHITNLGDDEKKLDIQDVMDVQERSIFLNDNEYEQPQTHWEKTKEATRNAMDRAGNTSQYIKYVNHHFEKQKSAINKVKEIKANYDRELKLLQNEDNSNSANFSSQFESNKKNLHELKKSIQGENKITRDHLNKLKSSIKKAENDLQKQELEIKKVDQQISNTSLENKKEQRAEEITNEILNLSKKIDAAQLDEIVKSLESSIIDKSKKKVVK